MGSVYRTAVATVALDRKTALTPWQDLEAGPYLRGRQETRPIDKVAR